MTPIPRTRLLPAVLAAVVLAAAIPAAAPAHAAPPSASPPPDRVAIVDRTATARWVP
jgi:hypothetical protein